MSTTKEAGQKGGLARKTKYSHEQLSEISKRAAATRKQRNPNSFKEMGSKGGIARVKNSVLNEHNTNKIESKSSMAPIKNSALNMTSKMAENNYEKV